MKRKIKDAEEWKACPFCGHKELEREPSTGDISCNVCAYTFYDTSLDNTWWNSRPIEDELQAENERLQQRIAELEEALTKIASYESMRFKLSPYEYGLLEQIVGIAEHALRDGK